MLDYIDPSGHSIIGNGYVIKHHITVIDMDEHASKFSFWLDIFKNITDDMYINPLPRKHIKKFYTNLKTLKGDFVVQLNEKESLQRVGDKVHYIY
jgi:hypothetical protein